MTDKPLFIGLVFDENDLPVDSALVGQEPCYVVDDAGFKRHIPAFQVDCQVLEKMKESIEGHEDIISEQATKMLGQDDIFTRAVFLEQLKNIDQQFDELIDTFLDQHAIEQHLVTYCSGRTCEDSHNLAQLLMDFGYDDVMDFIDGFPGWEAKGYPIE